MRGELPPGPGGPSLLHAAAWITRPVPWLLRARERYGPTFTIRLPNEAPWVVLTEPAAIRETFALDPEVGRAGEGNAILGPILGDRSVLLLDGREHLAQRRLLLPPFHGERLARQRALMEDVAAREVARWPAGPVAAQPRMADLTLDIILRVVLGVGPEDPHVGPLRAALAEMLDTVTDPRRLAPLLVAGPQHARRLPHLRRALRRMDDQLLALIARRRAGHEGDEDVLAMLLDATHEDGSPMTDLELRDELVTLLVAGHETTATALAWALERLLREAPEVWDGLADGDEPLADAVVKEVLRLRPPIPVVVRKLSRATQIGEHRLPAGAAAVPCAVLVGRDPALYPDPHAFRPSRWLGEDRVRPGTTTWIPFGGGVRRCLGAAFAEQEMRVVLLALAARLRLRAVGPPERTARRTIVLVPPRGGEVAAVG